MLDVALRRFLIGLPVLYLFTLLNSGLLFSLWRPSLLCGAETWPVIVIDGKKIGGCTPQVAKEKFGHFLEGKVTSEEVRWCTGEEQIEDIVRTWRLRWLRHLHQMEDNWIPKQPSVGKCHQGGKKRTSMETMAGHGYWRSESKRLNMGWGDTVGTGWRCCIAWWAHAHGRTEVKGQRSQQLTSTVLTCGM